MTEQPQPAPATTALAKTFDPGAIEAKWYAHWEASGAFRPSRPDAVPFTIVNPPPNVTGSLHIGHALDNTLQDIVIRYERLRGKDALWVVGTDHAGIATQMVVERQMAQRQDKRTNYSREAFVDKVWEWKHESGGTITGQLRRLGCSMDWSREQFTMDPHFTKAVVKVFVDLYNQGLLYRDKRLVNWDPGLKTAISDLEVETREVQGGFWHFKYPLADGVTLDDGRDYIEVATTRPETMLADMAVAVNGADKRYASVVGKDILQPITGRRFRIVADDHADPELGSGAVKITPGHDFNDFEVGKRAGIAAADMLNMFDAEAHVVQTADGLVPVAYIGLERFAARNLVVERMKEQGCLIPHVTRDKDGNETEHDAEPRTIQTPYGDRSNVVIEPWLTDQWYVDAATLAKPAIEAVKSGAIEIVPKSWEKTYFNWMENIQPWCVSRQLWWGHRIPAWYGPTQVGAELRYDLPNPFVAVTEESAVRLASKNPAYSGGEIVVVADQIAATNALLAEESVGKVFVWRDPDVLDTWFSSALWPFATLGWPEEPSQDRHAELDSASMGQPPVESVAPWTLKQVQGDAADVGSGDQSAPGHHAEPDSASMGQPPAESIAPWTLKQVQGDAGGGQSLLARHYPNDLLISGFDILFFWDARMAMQGIHFMGEGGRRPLEDSVPWKRLYLHGLVRAADGQKMSKSKGNVVDPLGLIDQYGADALRFFMAAMESQGRDVKMDEKRVEGYRNFGTKLWNAVRFAQANGIGASGSLAAPVATLAVNKWIIGEVVETLAELDKAMADLRFDAAAHAIYHFVWDSFCDWYLELIKGQIDEETKAVAGWVIDQILVMLHPFMPFITEELWHAQGSRACDLILADWPATNAIVDADAKAEIDWLIRLISEVRTARAELGVPPGARTNITMRSEMLGDDRAQKDQEHQQRAVAVERFRTHSASLHRLARLDFFWPDYSTSAVDLSTGRLVETDAIPLKVSANLEVVVDGLPYSIPLEGVIDIAVERARLTKSLEAAQKEARALEGRLANPAFVEKAKPEAVDKARADHADKSAEATRLAAALARLG